MRSDRSTALRAVEDLLRIDGVPESRKFAHQARLAEADMQVEALLTDTPDDGALLLASCRLAEARGRHDDALQRWAWLRNRSSEHRDLAAFHLGASRSRLGELTAARELLDTLHEPAGVSPHLLATERRRLAGRVNRATAQELLLRALDELDDGRRRNAQDLLYAGLVLSGVPREHRAGARAIVRAVCSLLTGGHVTTAEPRSGNDGRLRSVTRRVRRRLRRPRATAPVEHEDPVLPAAFVAGFGWSGSGAVFDYLAQFDHVVAPVASTEIPWIERPFGAKGVLRELEAGGDRARMAAARFVLASVLGIGDPAAGEPWRPDVVRSLGKVGGRCAVQVLSGEQSAIVIRDGALRLLSAAARSGSDQSVGESTVSELLAFLDRLVAAPRAAHQGAALAVLNNPIHGFNVRFVEHFGWATAVPVLRDPRDQYVSRLLESGGRKTGVDRFISTVSKHYERYERAVETHGLHEQVHAVQFEEFVTDAAVRRKFLERFGLDPGLDDRVTRYDPASSIPNVGIHREYDDRSEIRAIEQRMAPYLVDLAD